MIASTLSRQRDDLNARIERRSLSKQKKGRKESDIGIPNYGKAKQSLVYVNF